MTSPQAAAYSLLLAETAISLYYNTARVPYVTGYTRLFETLMWGALLYWGGFFN
jgi:hypothetical protein